MTSDPFQNRCTKMTYQSRVTMLNCLCFSGLEHIHQRCIQWNKNHFWTPSVGVLQGWCGLPHLPLSAQVGKTYSWCMWSGQVILPICPHKPYIRWPRVLNVLQLKKTHANRKSTSKLWKHQFDNTCTANTHGTIKYRNTLQILANKNKFGCVASMCSTFLYLFVLRVFAVFLYLVVLRVF